MTTYHLTIEQVEHQRLIRLPKDLSDTFPSRGMIMAKGFLKGQPLHAPVEPDGDRGHFLPISDQQATGLDLHSGEVVDLSLEATEDWPEPQLPDDLHEALSREGLLEAWDSLTVKAHWDWIRWIRATKNPATRAKRIGVAIDKLHKGDRRPCCFNRQSCTLADVAKSGVLIKAD